MPEIPITVLMPVYNAEKYLVNAINSILAQTHGEFEFLIINDGSTDHTGEILDSYRDSRIKIIHQDNKGVAAALRLGIEEAEGEYIARMDADDESLPARLEIQKNCLDQNREVVLVYGRHDLIDSQSRIIRKSKEVGFSKTITRWLLIWKNILTHPTVMMRNNVLKKHGLNYRLETNGAEDFDLWNRLSMFGDFLFLPQVLLRYRLLPNSVNRADFGKRQSKAYSLVIQENFQRYGLTVSSELSEELMILSGQTPINPLIYSYRCLPGKLHILLNDLSKNFIEKWGETPLELYPVQARQLTRWARYLLQSSKEYSASLLNDAFSRYKLIFFSRIFFLTLLVFLLPEKIFHRLNKKRINPLI